MAHPRDFTLTRHACDRLKQRDRDFAKEIVKVDSPALQLKAAYDFLHGATEERSFLNNSIFMTMLGEKYGFENRYTLFVRGNNVFVGVSNERGDHIVTVLNKNEHYVPHIRHSIKKFQKRENRLAA